MTKRWSLLLSLAAVAVASTSALAGVKSSYPVQILRFDTYTDAFGAIGTARNSEDTVQGIGCELGGNVFFGYSYVQCWAQTASGDYLTCVNRVNEDIKRAVSSLTANSYIEFQIDSSNPGK